MKRTAISFFTGITLLAGAAVCQAHPTGWFGHGLPQDLTHGEWTLVEMESRSLHAQPRIWLGFGHDKKVAGSGGVNQISGTYEYSQGAARQPVGPPNLHREGANLNFSPLAVTKKAGPKGDSEQEARFLELLSEVDHYAITADDELRLFHVGRPVLKFERVESTKK